MDVEEEETEAGAEAAEAAKAAKAVVAGAIAAAARSAAAEAAAGCEPDPAADPNRYSRSFMLIRRLSVRRTPPPRPWGVAGRRRCARQRSTSCRESMRRARDSRTSTLRGCSSSSAERSTPSRRRFGEWSRCSSGASPPLAASAAQSCASKTAMRSSRRRARWFCSLTRTGPYTHTHTHTH